MRPVSGSQTPRHLSLPPGKPDAPNDYGDRAVRLARLAGLTLDPWQELVLRAMLRTAPTSSQWAAYESLVLAPRQNGKSVILEAFDLAKLFLSPPGHLILHTAHLFPTAMESLRHLRGLVKKTPVLDAEVLRYPIAHGEEGIELENGSRLRFAARTVSGNGRGFSPDDVIFDEAYRLPPEAEEALLYGISAKPNPQLVYASSTGMPDSHTLRALVDRGRRGDDESLMLAEWSADPALDLMDEDQMWQAVAQSNPALGFRLDARKTLAEYRKAVAQGRLEGFGRERLGLWADGGRQAVFPPGAWEAAADQKSAIVGPIAFAVEVAQDRSWSCIAASGTRPDGLIHVQVAENHRGTDWVAAKLRELGADEVALSPNSPAGALIEDIEKHDVRVHKVPTQDYAQACGHFYDLVRDGQVRHLIQGELEASIEGAVKKPSGDAWIFDRRRSDVDISPLAAVVLAAHLASLERVSVYEERGVRFL